MNPIKTHLLNRLRPKDRTMTTMTDEEAFALGMRALAAGMDRKRGMVTTHEEPKWRNGVIIDFDYDGPHLALPSGVEEYVSPVIVPDLRDPGTKGHAVAQLRERKNDPELCMRAVRGVDDEGDPCLFWSIESATHYNLGELPFYPTEEETIVAAFEATAERGVIQGSGG